MRGSVPVAHTLAERGANKLWELLKNENYVNALGALSGNQAVQMAKAFDGTVHALAIIEDPAQAAMIYALDFPVLPGPEIQEQLTEKVQSDLGAIVEKEFANVPHKAHVCAATGPVHAEIIKFVNENDIDLVVIATHGHTGLSRILIGSVAERVVRECPCPVLTVRSQ